MGDNVYLWELDSTRNSAKECHIARETLYQQLFIEGRTVIMTYNQLADGRWMLPLLKDEEQYKYLLRLFQIGAIKISRYKNIRSVSQYVQNSLEKALEEKDNYVFSGMALKREERYILWEVFDAVRYGDPERLMDDRECLQELYNDYMKFGVNSEWIEEVRKPSKTTIPEYWNRRYIYILKPPERFDIQLGRHYDAEGILSKTEEFRESLKCEIDKLQIIYRYVKLILLISTEKTSDNKASNKVTPYNDIMDYILTMPSNKTCLSLCKESWRDLFVAAIVDMKEMKPQSRPIKDRSTWHRMIKSRCSSGGSQRKEIHDFEVLIADVCYNFTLESSINGVDCVFDDVSDINKDKFIDEFIRRLDEYYKLYKNGIHYIEDTFEEDSIKNEKINWKRLVEVREDIYKYEQKRGKKSQKTRKMRPWLRKVKKTQLQIPFLVFILSVGLFLILDFAETYGGEFFGDICHRIGIFVANHSDTIVDTFSQTQGRCLMVVLCPLKKLGESMLRVLQCRFPEIILINRVLIKGAAMLGAAIAKIGGFGNLLFAIFQTIVVGLFFAFIQKILPETDIWEITSRFFHKINNFRIFKRDIAKKKRKERWKRKNT